MEHDAKGMYVQARRGAIRGFTGWTIRMRRPVAAGAGARHDKRDAEEKREAADLLKTAIDSYVANVGEPLRELFIHGKVAFDDDEWTAFRSVTTDKTTLVGIRIKNANDIKLYRQGEYVALRGLTEVTSGRNTVLWTKGFIPRLQTYPAEKFPTRCSSTSSGETPT